MAAEQTSTDYIAHHLTNWAYGLHPEKGWKVAYDATEAAEMGFMKIHVDSMLWSIGLGIFFLALFWAVGRKATSGVPTKLQAFVELIVEFVDNSVRESYNGPSKLIAPLSLTIFVWIFLMNLMDLVPIDFIPSLAMWVGSLMGHDPNHVYFKIVATTDPNITLGMAIGVFFLIIGFGLKYKGVGGFAAIYNVFPDTWSWETFWNITALLSIMLGVMNLLPIPALDGGHVMFLLYEMISGKTPSDKFMEKAQLVGFVLLISLLLFANGNDIYKAIVGK